MPLNVNYSNGFDMNRVLPAMLYRLAWKEIGGIVLTNDNKTPKSGRFFDSFHAIANIINIKNNTEPIPANDTELNAKLEQMYKDVMFRCLSSVFTGVEFLDGACNTYNRVPSSQNTIVENTSSFVGYAIDVAERSDVSIQVNSLTLLFNAAATFNIHLFADGDPNPLITKSVTTVANAPVIIDVENFVFGYKTKLSNSSRYYIGYFQNDLNGAKAIREQANFNRSLMYCAVPCSLKASANVPLYNEVSQTFSPSGLNIEFSSFRDRTDTIVKQPFLFDTLVGLQMSTGIIESVMYTTRSNSSERILKENIDRMMVYMDLKGTVPISDAPVSGTNIAAEIKKETARIYKTLFPKRNIVNAEMP